MRITVVSWNANGLRSILAKTFFSMVRALDPQIICLQETKLSVEPAIDLPNHPYRHFHNAQRHGYSGTAVFSQLPPRSISLQTRPEETIQPDEGRVLLLEFDHFFLVNVYTPNVRADLSRLPLRRDGWDPAMKTFLQILDGQKPTIVCGDFNVAHGPADLARPSENAGRAGFTNEERAGFDGLLSAGFVDAFRALHPDRLGAYTWWAYRAGARVRNVGWRIDYFLVSTCLLPWIVRCDIAPTIGGSDHAPIFLELDLPDGEPNVE
ncbi:MAG: exodeoxyribonuclease III [Puniceicoccales bacterium]|jgi:exodeoxyribonuclease-3|nr:exodeoxyribonuclease III [Puniceicoccales bacterium]